jgi:hypothetical protein
MKTKTSLRLAAGLTLALVVSLGMTTPASATQKKIKYSLSAGSSSSVIALPPNIPVMVIGNETSIPSDDGVLQMAISNLDSGLTWSGSSVADGPKSSALDGATGDPILSLDRLGQVQLTIQFVLSKKGVGGTFGMVIKNLSNATASGQVTLFY